MTVENVIWFGHVEQMLTEDADDVPWQMLTWMKEYDSLNAPLNQEICVVSEDDEKRLFRAVSYTKTHGLDRLDRIPLDGRLTHLRGMATATVGLEYLRGDSDIEIALGSVWEKGISTRAKELTDTIEVLGREVKRRSHFNASEEMRLSRLLYDSVMTTPDSSMHIATPWASSVAEESSPMDTMSLVEFRDNRTAMWRKKTKAQLTKVCLSLGLVRITEEEHYSKTSKHVS